MSIVVTYCERVHSGLLGEPLNAVSNAAYLLCAWLLYRRWHRDAKKDPVLLLPILLLALLGIGSTAFHSYPCTLTLLLDVLPIFALMLVFCWLIQTRLLQHTIAHTGVSMSLLLASTLYLSTFSTVANGSMMYLPAALFSATAVILTGTVTIQRQLLLATLALLGALVLRTVDNQICESWPTGSHFLWHGLTALACYIAASSINQHSVASGQN